MKGEDGRKREEGGREEGGALALSLQELPPALRASCTGSPVHSSDFTRQAARTTTAFLASLFHLRPKNDVESLSMIFPPHHPRVYHTTANPFTSSLSTAL